jgi:hypothetical protein
MAIWARTSYAEGAAYCRRRIHCVTARAFKSRLTGTSRVGASQQHIATVLAPFVALRRPKILKGDRFDVVG